MEESENSPEFPHLGEIKCMRKQCVPGASHFLRAPGTRLGLELMDSYTNQSCSKLYQHTAKTGAFWNKMSYLLHGTQVLY